MGVLDRLLRRRRLPAVAKPTLEGDERIVAFAGAGGDDHVVATTRGLWLPGRETRLGWHEIHKATWSGRMLTVVAARPVGGFTVPGGGTPDDPATESTVDVLVDAPAASWQLLDPDQVPHQVRVRVQRSVAHTDHHRLAGGGGVRVVARRVSGADGLRWAVRFDDGVDPDDPQALAASAEHVIAARASLT